MDEVLKKTKKESSLFLITLATVVLGLDYVWNFIPGLPGFFSLNRFVFLAVFAVDVLLFSDKYIRSLRMYLVCGLILIGCLPFLVFDGKSFGADFLVNGLKLLGIFAYLIFFYFNCRDSKTAGRISTILFLSTGVMAVYVMGSQLGILGAKIHRWRGAVQFTSASGIFDPNIISLSFLPAFAFGPLIGYHWKNISGKKRDLIVILYICFCFAAFFQLNSRAGSLAVAASLIASLILRFIILPREERGGRLNSIIFLILIIGAFVYTQIQYNILGPIIGIYGETYLNTDTSFAIRQDSYTYLFNSLLSSPSLFGGGYRDYWQESGWMGKWPHSVFVDVYIRGGLLFLVTYISLYIGSMIKSLRGAFATQEIALKGCFAGFFCFMVGFLPMAITLSMEGKKLPWAIIGCIFGLAAARDNKNRSGTYT